MINLDKSAVAQSVNPADRAKTMAGYITPAMGVPENMVSSITSDDPNKKKGKTRTTRTRAETSRQKKKRSELQVFLRSNVLNQVYVSEVDPFYL